MSILAFALLLAVLGVFLFFINNRVAMDSTLKLIINIACVFVIVALIIHTFFPGALDLSFGTRRIN